MANTNLTALKTLGQSLWLDTLSRDLIDSGELDRWVNQGVTGVTTNPAIFAKAITGSDVYDSAIVSLARAGYGAEAVYRDLVLKDVGDAADSLLPVYEATDGADGFVCIEVSPHLAHDTAATVTEARDLWHALDRDNVMIKVPGTDAGLPAVTRLIAEGININITLLFGIKQYLQVAEAFLAGLESRLEAGKDLHRVASVASFFLSRIDTLLDSLLEKCAHPDAAAAQGETAIACARLAYARFRLLTGSTRFQRLASKGAHPQRLLWASTSAKNPAYADTHYVDPLIGSDTVNTMPLETLKAFLDHGKAASTLTAGEHEATALLDNLPTWGIDLDAAIVQLEKEGIRKFIEPYDRLLQSISQRCRSA